MRDPQSQKRRYQIKIIYSFAVPRKIHANTSNGCPKEPYYDATFFRPITKQDEASV